MRRIRRSPREHRVGPALGGSGSMLGGWDRGRAAAVPAIEKGSATDPPAPHCRIGMAPIPSARRACRGRRKIAARVKNRRNVTPFLKLLRSGSEVASEGEKSPQIPYNAFSTAWPTRDDDRSKDEIAAREPPANAPNFAHRLDDCHDA